MTKLTINYYLVISLYETDCKSARDSIRLLASIFIISLSRGNEYFSIHLRQQLMIRPIYPTVKLRSFFFCVKTTLL
jgi:hypothetical protein